MTAGQHTATEARRRAERFGRWAETLAAWHLRLKGFGIVHQRYRNQGGEIDLIARRGSLIIFVEVKARGDAATAAYAITPHQQQRIRRAEPDAVTITWADAGMTYPDINSADTADKDTTALRALTFNITLSQKQPALTPLTREVHGLDATTPVLRLMLKPVWNEGPASDYHTPAYPVLRTLLLMRAHLSVSVTGLTQLNIASDDSSLDIKKPFEPFGSQPAVGSRFYLGHSEIVTKKIDSLSFNITWMGVPSDLGDHYNNYPGNPGNTSFKAKVSLIEGNVATDFPDELALFTTENAETPKTTSLVPPAEQGNPDNAITESPDITEWNRFYVCELGSPDFQHSVYPTVALQKSLQLSSAIAEGKLPMIPDPADPAKKIADMSVYQVNLPYTPKIKSLSLGYVASAEMALDSTAVSESAIRVFHVQPFGYAELKPGNAKSSHQTADMQPGFPFLPQYDFEGELYIGLRNVSAPQNLSLLFQVAEGSANPDLEPEPVLWSYLSGNEWLTLQDGSLIADATRGLINSGIMELSLKPVQSNTLLDPDLYWIRAAIRRSSNSVCDMVAIHPNAILATFVDANNADDHLAKPLPSESISEPVVPIPGIAILRQPYTSFAGKRPELDQSFYLRVSERLRHKQRALTAWDYERLVLEKFPQIYKAKCLRTDFHAHPDNAGQIELVVIPNIRNRLPFNPFEPKVPADQIRDIETFLHDKTPPFASIKVKNPHYIEVKIRCAIRYRPGQDVGYCGRQLNDELNRFLSPWAYEEGADLVIGGSLYANSIIDFIDRRDYVDYLAGFKLFTDRGPVAEPEDGGYHVSANRPDGILVAAREHDFDTITDSNYQHEKFTGINYMKIGLDFSVA